MKGRNILNSPRLLELKRKRRRIFFGKFLLVVFSLATIFAGLIYLSRLSALNIKEVKIISSGAIDAPTVKTAVETEITGNYLWFLPKTNILFYPKKKIETELYHKFKRIKDIDISIKDQKILEVQLTEREATYLWCEEPEKCSFMDSSGYVFDTAPYFSGNVYFKFFGPLSGDNFAPEIFDKVIAFKNTLLDLGIKPTSLYLVGEDIEIYLSSKSPYSPKIIFKKDFNLEAISENLQTALDAEPLKSNFKNKYASLEYIDLRYGNKVYYKFR